MLIDKKILFILLLGVIVFSWNIGSVDLISDDATYSYRALGYFDYLASAEQTTPIQWFGSVPAWANLSFHDAPPFVFGIQKVFFVLFGDNVVAARIPFVLAGVLTAYVIFLIANILWSKRAGYLSALIFILMSFTLWSVNTGYLESIEVAFICLSIYFWIKSSREHKKKNFYWWGLCFGLALMSKYTAVFLLPLFIIDLFIYRRDMLRTREIYIGVLILLLLLSPVIVYNIAMYSARGHFDAPISSVVGMETDDFLSLSERRASFGMGSGLLSILRFLYKNISFGLMVCFYLSFYYYIYSFIFKSGFKSKKQLLLLMALMLVLILLVLVGVESRFLIILIPFVVLIIAFGFDVFFGFLQQKNSRLWLYFGCVALFLVLGFELFYNINSNFLINQIGSSSYLQAEQNLSQRKLGFNSLDKYIRENVLPQELELKRPENLADIDSRAAQFVAENNVMYFFDDSANWFAHNWYFRRYSNYYGLPMVPFHEQSKVVGSANLFDYYSKLGIKNFYFIYMQDERLIDSKKADQPIREMATKVATVLDGSEVEKKEIKNRLGEVVAAVYYVEL